MKRNAIYQFVKRGAVRRGLYSLLGVLAFGLLAGCSNPFQSPAGGKADGAQAGGGLVRIQIGEETSARTVQPGADAIAGYRLTFSGGPAHEPVDITMGNSADVYLADGTYTITATAYRAGGTVGNAGDAAASGFISITLSEGVVSGGVVPPIILGPAGTGNGTLHYAVTIDTEISGVLKLWDINGINPVNGFATNGVLDINASVDDTYSLSGGSYTAEIKLINGGGMVAFRREVVEIWPGVTTDLVFTPAPQEYLDPSAILANSGADMAASSTIGGTVIGTGTGSGASESDPVSYTLAAGNISNAAVQLDLTSDSRFATVSWAATTGTAPDTWNSSTITSDFSSSNVLWVKVVSEDTSTTKYYKFTLYPPPPSNGTFTDTDTGLAEIGGNITWTPPASTAGISGYHIYFGSVSGGKLTGSEEVQFTITNPSTGSHTVLPDTVLPTGAKYFLIYAYNSGGNDYPLNLSIPIQDVTFNNVAGPFRVKGIGNSNSSFVTWADPVLTITGSGAYYITPNGSIGVLEKQIVVQSDADITLENVNLDVSAVDDAVAFDISSVSVNLTLLGTNIFKSGENKAGLQAPEGSTLTITADSTGSLEAVGGQYGAGIGGGRGGAGGTFAILGGTVTATGGEYSAGIGRGYYGGSSGSITGLSGNAVVFASSIGPALTAGENATQALVFNGDNVTMYGSATLGQNITIPADRTLIIPSGNVLTISSGKTLTNNGMIYVKTGGIINGNVTKNQPKYQAFAVTGDISYTYDPGLLTITGTGPYTIGMADGVSGTDYDRILIQAGVIADITLNGVNINLRSIDGACAFDMSGATVNLTLKGNNTFLSGRNRPGLQVPDGAFLTITSASTGSLDARAYSSGGWGTSAGIGGGEGASGGTITINGGTITAEAGFSSAGIGGSAGGAGGTITINGGMITATGDPYGGNSGAGIGGGYNGAGGTITINGGTVTATGGGYTSYDSIYAGAGIGGGRNGAGGTITISGGMITATGHVKGGAGIGGGYNGAGGTITIKGGTIIATGQGGGAGIGGGCNGTGGTIEELSGGALVFASSIQPTLTAGDNATQAIVFDGTNGIMYEANITLLQNGTIPSGRVLFIPSGNTLTISPGKTLTNNGVIYVETGGSIFGTVTGNQPEHPAFTVTGDTSYTYVPGALTITGDGTYTIGMAASASKYDRIVVGSGVTADITLNNVNIDVEGQDNTASFDMTGATVNLTLLGTNSLKSANDRAGLQVPEGASLTITANSTGSLEAVGGYNGAGIGGGYYGAGGTFAILGGTVTATGGYNGAGIGGGYRGSGGTITELSGNAVVFASSIAPPLTAGDNATQAIVFNGNAGTMYGSVTLQQDVEIPSGKTLGFLDNSQTLTIPGAVTLTNDGTINKNGGTIVGTVGGSGSVND